MLRSLVVVALMLLGAVESRAQGTPQINDGLYVTYEYDPGANPDADLALAVQRASAANKRILIVVGGDWCVWCHILDNFLQRNSEVRAAFAGSFVMLKVNYSRENENADFLGRYPVSSGYPDFLILNQNGQFLAQQDTGSLERGHSYDRARMLAFARRWRPP